MAVDKIDLFGDLQGKFREGIKRKDVSNYLFSYLAKQLIWKIPKDGENVTVNNEGNSCPLNASQAETFFGYTIGLGNSKKARNGRKISIESREFRFNDAYGETSYRNWIDRLPVKKISLYQECIILIRDIAFSELKKKAFASGSVPQDEDLLLQCNINLYKSAAPMVPHNDDVGTNCPTFYPAAATCLLMAKIMPVNGRGNFLVQNREGENLFSCADPLTLFVLSGKEYTEHKHMAQTGWHENREVEDQPMERISLNFRLVKPDAWKTLGGTEVGGKLD